MAVTSSRVEAKKRIENILCNFVNDVCLRMRSRVPNLGNLYFSSSLINDCCAYNLLIHQTVFLCQYQFMW